MLSGRVRQNIEVLTQIIPSIYLFQHWLDPVSRISRQLKGSKDVYDLYFGVKFYAADPTKLIEEITR